MPLYKYECANCNTIFDRLITPPSPAVARCFSCGGVAQKLLTRSLSPTVKVLLDKYRKKSVLRNINKVMKDRSWNHQKKYEIGGMISKYGVGYLKKVTNFFDKTTGLLKKDKVKNDEGEL